MMHRDVYYWVGVLAGAFTGWFAHGAAIGLHWVSW